MGIFTGGQQGLPNMKGFCRHLIKVLSSVLCAGILYFLWMGVFLVLSDRAGAVVRGIFWLLAPVVTAAGFAVGLVVSERLLGSAKVSFLRVFIWPLVGCAVGAAVVYWYGPMLIVFGMFLVGAASVVLRQATGSMSRRAGTNAASESG